MELSDRFKYIMKLNQLSASAFAEEIGVQRSSVSHVLSGRNKPSLEFMQKVLKRFPKVDANWLVNGTTSVDKSQFELAEKESNEGKENREQTINENIQHQNEDSPHAIGERTITSSSSKKIQKIVVFYTDGTFEEVLK
tara:strand:- start:1201 stop:1614 length:414 start_codon:yes stop_codon:yes gene_type:complete